MAETVFSRGYKMKLIGTGLEAGTWGTSTNENLKRIDQTLGGISNNFSVTAPPGESSWSSPVVTWLLQDSTNAWVPGSDGRNRYINFTGTPGVNVIVNIRGNSSDDVNNERVYWVRNSMTAGAAPGFTITFDGGSGSDFILANGATALIYSDGSGKVAGILDSLQVAGLDFTQEATGAAVIKLPTNEASALLFEDTTTGFDFIKFATSTDNEKLILGGVDIPNLEINSPTVDFNSTELNLESQVVDIKLKNAELRALDFVSASDVRILTLDTNATRVEIPSGSTLDIASGGTLQVDSGSTLNIQSVLTADAGAAITGAGTIDSQVIGGNAAVAGTFTTGIANTTFQSPLLDATGASGQLKFNTLDVGLKISSGVLQVKQTASDAYGGLYASDQVSDQGVYKEITGISWVVQAGGSSTVTVHGFNPAIPRLLQLVLVCGSAGQGYAEGDEVLGSNAGPGFFAGVNFGANLVVDNTNATVIVGANGVTILSRSGASVGTYVAAIPADWSLTVRMWK